MNMKVLVTFAALLMTTTTFAKTPTGEGTAVRCTFTQYDHTDDTLPSIPVLARIKGAANSGKHSLKLMIGPMEGFVRILKENKVLLLIQDTRNKKSLPSSMMIMEPDSHHLTVSYEDLEKDPKNDYRLSCKRTKA